MKRCTTASNDTLDSRVVRRAVVTRVRRRVLWASRSNGGSAQGDLAVPLGISFAAVLSEVMNKNKQGERISVDLFSKMCTSAVNESITNIYGDKYDYFLRNFEKSFRSTLRTLHLISHAAIPKQEESTSYTHSGSGDPGNISKPSMEYSQQEGTSYTCSESGGPGNISKLSMEYSQQEITSYPLSSSGDPGNISKPSTEYSRLENTSCLSSNSGDPGNFSKPSKEYSHAFMGSTISTQIIPHGNLDNQLVNISRSNSYPHNEMNHHVITTLERSLSEQVRSNNLKEFEMGLIMKKLELKRSQLELSSYSHMLERVKVRMGMAKAMFREEKLKNHMQDARFTELVKSFIDVLVTGLIVMSVCFGYATYSFSYQRITEVTEACSAISKESKAWWLPKQVSSFNSGWLFVRCHLIALSRLGFGIIVIFAVAWLILQKSHVAGPSMPITFNVMLLGVFCGFTGKWCVDALGGDGLYWLISWELLCLIHFLGNAFPSTIYRLLHGPLCVSQGIESAKRPYWIRRYALYAILLVILPVSAGLLPFASVVEWMEHLREKINLINVGAEAEL